MQMAGEQMAIVDKETEQREMFSSSEENSACVPRKPLDFLKFTPSQFGINVQSFIPTPPESKEKSRLAQLKARRRSSVGVRGSPETNSLIRFIAQQRLKNSSHCQTPKKLGKCSPFLPRAASTLKQKIASFQSLMGVAESEVCDLMPRQDDNTGECMKTRDYLSEYNQEEGKENHYGGVSPAPSKKRRVGPFNNCKVKIKEAHTPSLHLNGSGKEGDKEPVAECNDAVNKGPRPSSETKEETQPVLPSTPPHGYSEPPMSLKHYNFSSQSNQQDNVFEPQSPNRVQPSGLISASPEESFSAFQFSSFPSQIEMKSSEQSDSSVASATKKKKKQVHFGCPLSPEFFDKKLPPSTPLQKGGTPAQTSTPGGILRLNLTWKTPQRDESCTTQAQPDLSSAFGASPLLVPSHNSRMLHIAEDGVEEFKKIIFPSIEDSGSAVMTDTELVNYAQLNLNDAFNDEALSPVVTTEVKSETSPACQWNALKELASLPEEKQPEAVSKAAATLRHQEKKAMAESESTNGFPAARSRKRKLPEQNAPVRRSTRSPAKPFDASQLRKSTASNRWKKEVNLSLYGSREYASKNPSLSPIRELSVHPSAEGQCSPPTSYADESTNLKNESAESASSGPDTSASIGESTSGTPLSSGPKVLGKKRCSPRFRTTRRGRFKEARVSNENLPCVESQIETEEKTSEKREEEITAVSRDVPSQQESAGTEKHCTITVADSTSTHTDAKSEWLVAVDGSTSEQTNTVTLTTQPAQKVSRRRRRSVNLAEEQPEQQVETQQKKSSDSAEEAAPANGGLASWQAEMNFEDVFKRAPSRGQRSVRRSLRNQSNTDNDMGLAWVPQISPEKKKGTSMKTRSRKFSSTVLPTNPV
ncbi:cell division cycle-associated protein 2 isoform X2 [Vanacampus margaritifer]